MSIVLLILMVDIGLAILWLILKTYWSHKEYLEMITKEPDAILKNETEINNMLGKDIIRN